MTCLRKEGFQPFMAAQTRVRDDSRKKHAKHMLRLRRKDAIGVSETKEIVLLNSHDGANSDYRK
jgi:2'-5' RNA ligase